MPSDEEVREDTAQWRRGVTVLDILYLNVFLCHKIFAFAFFCIFVWNWSDEEVLKTQKRRVTAPTIFGFQVLAPAPAAASATAAADAAAALHRTEEKIYQICLK